MSPIARVVRTGSLFKAATSACFLSASLALPVTLLLALPAPLAAQELTASVSGTVTDPSGAIIKGATVTLTNTDRGSIERTLTTNAAGYYTAASLPLGTYTVHIVYSGFKTEDVTGLVLHVNDALTVNRTLVVGRESDIVTVSADRVQLNLEDATSAGLISGVQARELVLNNRNYEQLITLQPGVAYGGATDQLYIGSTVPSGSSATVAFSVNGGRTTSNNWTVDGADNVDRGANLTLSTFPSVDAIAEFKTLRGQYSAEFGRNSSGQIDVAIKSGTNNLHGSAYEFFRNDYLNANTWVDKNVALASNFTPRPKLRYNDFGGTIGGPVYIPHLYNGHDKTFFFFSDEARRVVQYSTGQALVPTQAERSGDFTNEYYLPTGASSTGWASGPVTVCTAFNPANGVCTATGNKVTNISPTAAAYQKDLLALLPIPPSQADIASGLDPHTIVSTVPNYFTDNQIIVKIDQRVGSRLNLFYTYIHDTLPVTSGSGTFTTVPIPGIATTSTKQPGTQQIAHGTFIFNPTTVLDMGYAYTSSAINTTPIGALTTAHSPDVNPALPYANQLGVIPTLGFNGYLTALGSTGIYNDYNKNHEAFGSVTKTVGRHTFRAGLTYNHYQKRENATGGNQGGFNFGVTPTIATTGLQATSVAVPQAFANFLLGNANGGTTSGFTQTSLAITPDIQQNIYETFLQDHYRATPRLSLDIGMRYSYFGQPIDANGRLSGFDPASFNASKAPTISSTGLICTASPCANADGLNSGVPNANADYSGINYINGMIFATSNAPNGQASPFGSHVGATAVNNFAPRVGFAFDVFGDGHTALRGGYGWAYDESEVSYYETAVFNNPPAISTFSPSTALLDNPAGGTAATATIGTTPGRVYATPKNFQTPYVQQYSLDIQQAITPTFMLDVGYFGTHGTHLLGLVELNEPTPGSYLNADGSYKVNPIRDFPGTATAASACAYTGTATTGQPLSGVPAFISTTCDRALNQIKPYPGYFSVSALETAFSSNYNSLQVKATKRFRGQSLFDVNYTWSKDLTNSQSDYSSPPQVTSNPNADYGRAAVDRNNILTFDAIYELPFFQDQKGLVGHLVGGWEFSGIYAINSGLPLSVSESAGGTVYYGYTNPLNGQANGNIATDAGGLGISGNSPAGFRPDQIGNPQNGYGQQIHNKLQWFYRGAFASPLPQTFRAGNARRGTINGPGFNRLDIGLFRNFKIREGLFFQLRGEGFNVINHTNLQTVNVTATSTAFGQISAARDNRILQVAGKINF